MFLHNYKSLQNNVLMSLQLSLRHLLIIFLQIILHEAHSMLYSSLILSDTIPSNSPFILFPHVLGLALHFHIN